MKVITCTTDITPESRFDLDSVLFFDIESTGLSKVYSCVYLIGCAYREGGVWNIRQYLAEHLSEEGELVASFLEFARNFQTLVHFNGAGFDVPYMDSKAADYGLEFRLSEMENIDILKRIRAAKKLLPMEKMNQKSVERFLKIRRDDEMSGGELIPVYFDYQKTGDERLERFLLLHNFDDVKGMLRISPAVNYAEICEGGFYVQNLDRGEGQVTFDCVLDAPIPRPFEKEDMQFLLAANDAFMQLIVPVYRGTAHYYLADYKNYYYLPQEDKVIRKELAQFVDKEHKVKATKKNCFLKKESSFLPQKETLFEPSFCLPDAPKTNYFEADKLIGADTAHLKQYVLQFVKQ